MQNDAETRRYRVWGVDKVVYGPVELPTVAGWIQSQLVTETSWIFVEPDNCWLQAGQVPELKVVFGSLADTTIYSAEDERLAKKTEHRLRPGSLARLRLLAGMDKPQLRSFIHYMEILKVKKFAYVVRKGDHGDSMYLILDGELRAAVVVDGKETVLATMRTGDFFGEIALLDEGPRSADVIANEDSQLLRISAGAFAKLLREAPALAAPFLYNLSRSVAGRIRHLTKLYLDSIHFTRIAATINRTLYRRGNVAAEPKRQQD